MKVSEDLLASLVPDDLLSGLEEMLQAIRILTARLDLVERYIVEKETTGTVDHKALSAGFEDAMARIQAKGS